MPENYGPAGRYPDYSKDVGERIRFLIQSRPESLGSALSELGMDPFSARYYGKKGAQTDPDSLIKYLRDTEESRKERRQEAGRKRAKGTRGAPSPWSE